MDDFTGVCPVISTPFTDDGDVDYGSLRTQIAGIAAGGCHGAVLFGYAGEFYKLTDDERTEITRVAVEASRDHGLPLYASITDHATQVATERARAAEELGVDGLMVLPPFIVAPGEAAVRAHVESIARAVSLPVMVQYAPENTGVSIAAETFADVSRSVPNVVCYKVESTPSGTYIERLLSEAPPEVEASVGSGGTHVIEAFDRGATGVIPGAAVHEVYVEIYERYEAGGRAGARELHGELLPLLSFLGQGLEMFIHYEKTTLERRGLIESAYCRRPGFDPDDRYDAVFEELVEPLLAQCR